MSTSHLLSFADLAVSAGSVVHCASNQPLDMNNPGSVWFVESGAIDVFLVESRNGVEQTALQLLIRAEESRLVPGVASASEETTLSLRGKGLPGTVLRQLSIHQLSAVNNSELANLIDAWIMDLTDALSRDFMFSPLPDVLAEPGQILATVDGILSSRRAVVWAPVSTSETSASLYMGLVEAAIQTSAEDVPADVLPLTPESWLQLTQPRHACEFLSSETLANEGRLLSSLLPFHRLILATERLNRVFNMVDEANLERASTEVRRTEEDRARRQLFNVTSEPEQGMAEDDDSNLARVIRIIGQHEGITFKWPKRTDTPEISPRLVDILDVSGVRGRKVDLNAINDWWTGESDAMLAFRADDGSPVALLPSTLGRYRMFDPATGKMIRVTDEVASSLKAEAWLFYRPLAPMTISRRGLLNFIRNGLDAHVARFALLGLISGLFLLLPALTLGFVVNHVILHEELNLLYSVTTGLAGAAVLWALIYVLQGMTLMRLEGRIVSQVESAFWDRLLKLPLNILNRYPSADRAIRGMAFHRLRDDFQGVVANNLLSVVFLLPALLIIFIYDIVLGSVTAVFGLASMVITIFLGSKQISPYETMIHTSHRLTGVLYQFINGIVKLRIDGAEGSAYAVWARHYGEQQRAELELGEWNARLQAFCAALPLLAAGVVLVTTTLHGAKDFSVGNFLIIYTAFMLFITGVVRLGVSFGTVSTILPELNQIRPFLETPPEAIRGQEPVEHIGGDLLFDRVSFRYDPKGPLVLDDVSIHARRGEFIAITGESGAGKSTLFQLALGLSEPSTGTVYYDGRDLRQLNVKQVRRKIGAVPQKPILHPQDLWDNIAGGQEDIDSSAVWEAARAASVDKVIERTPMQMLTCVGDDQSVLSGGEVQRIAIARALAQDSRILLLDEATNFLDNDSQSNVMNQLEQLPMTRIVIAHRLTTLQKADRIYVMQAGKIVESGNYEELTAADGLFRELVRRQEV